ncbi:MAG TPA: dTDP-4-dehydrorhamnose 3,5-epimerase family protein [Pseudonocardiaceae bacterium]
MKVRDLSVPGAFEFSPTVFPDSRGLFLTPYTEESFVEVLGHPLHVAQTNHSVSRRGVVRGVHFAAVPPGQAKYVYCPRGAFLDVVVDLREGSPTFGQWDVVHCDETSLRAVYVSEGLGHAMVALTDDTAISYLCSAGYNPGAEFAINPMDPELALPWPDDVELVLSERDLAAPSLADTRAAGRLPSYQACLARYAELRAAASR